MSKVKKKTPAKAPLKAKSVAAKVPAKPAAKKVVKAATVKGAPAKKAASAKAAAKPAKTTAAKAKSSAKAPASAKAAVKPIVKSSAKPTAKPAAKGKTPAVAVKGKASAKPVTVVKASKAEKPAKGAKTPTPAPTETPTPKTLKSKKGREEVPPEPEEEIVLLDAEGRRYCRVRECDQAASVDGYCRYHYLLYWKNIQVRKKILSEGKLERYIEELTARYPDKYLEMLKKDLRTEKDFLAAIQELEIDESSVDNEYEDEAQNYLDEVRGMSSEAGSNDRDEEF